MDIRSLALDVTKAVEVFVTKAKELFYSVMLLGHRCPKCHGSLAMVSEGRCQCASCGNRFDPTIAFQQCSACAGIPILRVRRYQCGDCGRDIQSKFLFDGLVFDPAYFRNRMAESRERRTQQRERIKKLLAECRSNELPLGACDLTASPGLVDALNSLTLELDAVPGIESRDEFDLQRYEAHIVGHIQNFPVSLRDVPPLSEHARKDLIWRFITIIFLAHRGVIDVWQEGTNIMVIKHETDRERQDLRGDLEAVDGVQGSLGRAQTW